MERIVGPIKRDRQEFLDSLDAMPFEEAREKILKHDFGFSLEHDHHKLAMQWLHQKESLLQDGRLEAIERTVNALRKPHWSVVPSFVLLVITSAAPIAAAGIYVWHIFFK